jgi:hypothetical protein
MAVAVGGSGRVDGSGSGWQWQSGWERQWMTVAADGSGRVDGRQSVSKPASQKITPKAPLLNIKATKSTTFIYKRTTFIYKITTFTYKKHPQSTILTYKPPLS